MTETAQAVITAKGAERWRQGHPWIYRTDVASAPSEPGVVRVADRRGRFQGMALCSPRSQIRLRLLSRDDVAIDGAWWHDRIAAAAGRRAAIDATAYRVVHGEGD